jgi:hypothetical protein
MNRDFERTEHLAVRTDRSLREICSRLEAALRTSPFEFDHENETEWGIAKYGALEINVSRPFEKGTLKKWDDSVPEGFDVGVSICVPPNADAPSIDGMDEIARTIASALSAEVVHHRTWTNPSRK